MKLGRKHILSGLFIMVLGAIFIYSFQEEEITQEAYSAKMEEQRRNNNLFMKNASDSPLTESMKTSFTRLNYFPADLQYKVLAKMTPIDKEKLYIMPMSDGTEEKYIRYAYAEFELMGKKHQLLLLQPWKDKDSKKLFLAFGDLTNGDQTYGGGRYIDLQIRNKNYITIDFNLAYNPSCVFNYKYSCPLPPRENMLDIPVLAGEKMYEHPTRE
jgi:uncharacterized protein